MTHSQWDVHINEEMKLYAALDTYLPLRLHEEFRRRSGQNISVKRSVAALQVGQALVFKHGPYLEPLALVKLVEQPPSKGPFTVRGTSRDYTANLSGNR